ncbi:tyrosine--tRNA ligase [Sphingobacterium suaedae]|uniref:Tyrosine--tRNA ligase n=1 Tax=Sphingobacterium suaedae TaxID=1686402 RepID=A0ABW5KF67_9SPHI
MDIIQSLIDNVEILLPENGLEEKLIFSKENGKSLTIKLGFDPTAPDLHLGHAVVLRKLKQFQDLGHEIVILVGSFTARIGDPTGKNKSRPPLTMQEVHRNAETYINQLSMLIDITKARIVYNADWLEGLTFASAIKLMSHITVAQLLHRHDFNKRFQENTPIGVHELLYPILQGYDSVHIACDIEMGGTDQLFNCIMGRQLQESYGMPGQVVMCMPLLRGTDGKEKMSKSLNNTIGLTDPPNEMFGKTMSIPDDLLSEYVQLATDLDPHAKIGVLRRLKEGVNPMDIKLMIAKNIVKQYHGSLIAQQASDFFKQQFQRKNFFDKIFIPISLERFRAVESISLAELCTSLQPAQSTSMIRRLIEQGAVSINNEKVSDPHQQIRLSPFTKIKIGKKDYFELLPDAEVPENQ